MTSDRVHLLEVGSGAHNIIGDQMRHMAGDRQHQVMVTCAHDFDIRTQRLPKGAHLSHRIWISVFGRRQNTPPIDEKRGESGIRTGLLCPRHRMGGNKMCVSRYDRRQRRNHCALYRANVGYDRAWPQRRCGGAAYAFVSPDWGAKNDAIRVPDRSSQIARRLFAERQGLRANQRLLRTICENDAPSGVLQSGCSRDGRADEPNADDRQLVEYRLVEPRPEPLNHVRHA